MNIQELAQDMLESATSYAICDKNALVAELRGLAKEAQKQADKVQKSGAASPWTELSKETTRLSAKLKASNGIITRMQALVDAGQETDL